MTNTRINPKILIAQFFVLVLLSCGFTACSNTGTTQSNTEVNNEYNQAKFADSNATKDAQILIDIALINLEEIKLGKLAQKNGGSDDVKELGKMMEQAHTQSYNDLTVLTQTKIITIPTTLSANGEEFYTKMSALNGADFDKQYCDIMVNDHKKAIELLNNISQESRDADIKQFATQTNALLSQHLEHAISYQEKYK